MVVTILGFQFLQNTVFSNQNRGHLVIWVPGMISHWLDVFLNFHSDIASLHLPREMFMLATNIQKIPG